MPEAVCRRLLVQGRVQGVGFRYATADEAARLGLTGWVRNRRDGTVEAVVSGPESAVLAMIAWAHRGPPAARVTAVEVTAAEGIFASFELRPTV